MRQRRRVTARRLILGGTLLVAGYVLSAGPMSWLVQYRGLPEAMGDLIRIAYLPLHFLGGSVPWLGDLLDWYRQTWTG